LFESASDFLLAIANNHAQSDTLQPGTSAPAGLLLVLDDLHWADKPTLLLLQHLARRLPDAPLLVAGTYRTTDLGQDHPLMDVLADLHRERLVERLVPAPFASTEVAALIEGVTGAPPATAVVEAIERETEGNPFFVEEVVEHLRSEGRNLTDAGAAVAAWGIPEGVRAVIGRRLARLGATTNQMLQVSAVLGEGFAFDVLAAAGDIEHEGLLTALEEALSAGLLREEEGGYRFTHALIRETVRDGLNLPRRQRLHLRAAEAIERVHARRLAPHAGALALHYRLAGTAADPSKGLTYLQQAAEAALAVFAWEEAAAHLQAALGLVDPGDAAIRCDLLLALGNALSNAGAPRRAADEVAPEALRAAEAAADGVRASKVCQLALEGLFRFGTYGMAATPEYRFWAEQADHHAAPGTAERVRADIAQAVVARQVGRPRKAWFLASQALALARELNEPDALFAAAEFLFAHEWSPRNTETVHNLAAELARWPRSGIRPRLVAAILGPGGMKLLDQGDRARVEAMWRDAADLAARTGDAFLGLVQLIVNPLLDTVDGRFNAAVETGRQLITRSDELGMSRLGRVFAGHGSTRPLIHLGREEDALALPLISPWSRIVCLAHLGRKTEAQEELRTFLERFKATVEAGELSIDIALWVLETAILVEDRDATAVLADHLRPIASLPTVGFALTCVARHLGAAAVLLGDHAAARSYYEQALAVCATIRFRPEIALTRLQLAELLLAHNPSERAIALAHLDFAISELREMGMQPALERALTLKDRLDAGPGRRTAPAYPDGLSQREVEVLRLLAAGRTNQEIADALVLSVRTIENHTASIYAKIGARSRAEATAYAFRQGLVLER